MTIDDYGDIVVNDRWLNQRGRGIYKERLKEDHSFTGKCIFQRYRRELDNVPYIETKEPVESRESWLKRIEHRWTSKSPMFIHKTNVS